MSFVTYLCWLLGISVPSECDAGSYDVWMMGECATEGDVDTDVKGDGHRDAGPRHAKTNIDVSI